MDSRGPLGISDSLANTPFALTAEQRRLRESYRLRWAFYLGLQNTYIDTEDETVQLVVNYVRAMANKINDYMFNGGFRFVGNADLWPFVEPIVSTVWGCTDQKYFGIELGQMGGVTGDVFVKVWWDSDPFSSTYNSVQFSVIPSSNVIPIWAGGRTGKDRKMLSCRVVTVENEYGQGSEEPDRVTYTTVYYPDVIQQYRNSTLISEEANALGEIPIVHIQNQPLSGDCHGVSDVEDLIGLQDEINDKISSIASVIHYHGSPLTAAYGIKKGNLEIGEGRIIHLPKKTEGVSLENVDRSSNIRESVEFLNMLKEYSHEMASVPEASLGKMQPISNTSGVALHMQYQPIMHIIGRKIPTYGAGLVEMTRLGIKMLMLYDPSVVDGHVPIDIGPSVRGADRAIELMYPIGTVVNVSITSGDWRKIKILAEWPEILPKDALMELEMARSVQTMGLLPDRLVLEKIVKAGVINIPFEEIDEAIEDARMDSITKMQVQMGMYGGYGMEGGVTGQNESGPGSGSAMQSPQETVGGQGEDQEETK